MYFNVFFVTLLSLISYSVSCEVIKNTLPVSTYIDKSKLYPYSLSMESNPSKLILNYSENLNRFNDSTSFLLVNTNIPAQESVLFYYRLNLLTNDSQCQEINSPDGTSLIDFMNVFIDGELINEGDITSLKPLDSIDESGFRIGQNQVLIRSDEINDVALKCNGEVSVLAELSI